MSIGTFCSPPNTNWYKTQPSNWSTTNYPNGPSYDVILGSSGGAPTALDISVTIHSLTVLPDGGLEVGMSTTLTANAFDFQGDGAVPNVGGSGYYPILKIADGGSLTKSGGSGRLTIGPLVHLSGSGVTIGVNSGEIYMIPVGNSDLNWTNFTYNIALNATNTLALLPNAWMQWYGTYTGSGAGTFVFSSGAINPYNATFNFPGPMFQWTGGTLGNGSSFTNLGVITAAGGGTKTLCATVYNPGTLAVSGTGGLAVSGNPLGTINNLAGGIVDIRLDADVTGGGVGIINNRGLFRKSGGTGISIISAAFNNLGGTIEVDSGTLSLTADGTSTNGTFNVSAGAVLNLLAGNSGQWQEFVGTFTGSGNGTVLLGSGTIYADYGATLNFPGALFQWTGGTLWGTGITNRGTITAAGTGRKTFQGTVYNPGTLAVTNSGELMVTGNSTFNN